MLILKNPGFFSKIWSMIKAIGAWIVKGLTVLKNWVKRLFSRSNSDKTPDDRMEELGVNPSNNIPADGNDINQIKNVRVERDPSSKMQMNETIKVMYKGLRVKFDKSGIRFIGNPGMKFVPDQTRLKALRNDYGETPGKWMIGRLRWNTDPILGTLALIHDQSRYDFVNSIGDVLEKKDFVAFYNKMDLASSLKSPSNDLMSIPLKINDLDKLSKLFGRLNDAINKITDEDIAKISPEQIKAFNSFILILNMYQYSINAITTSIAGVYQIDGKYIGTIKDVDTMAKFVHMMISDGIPPKFVANNCYLAASSEMNTIGSKDKPIWGQTRLVLFPKNLPRSVYKIALSPAGVNGNQNELKVTNILKKSNQMDPKVITPVESITNDGCIATVERAVTNGDKVYTNEINSIWRDVNNRLKKANANHYIDDIYSDNVGRSITSNNPIIMDYGYIQAGYLPGMS